MKLEEWHIICHRLKTGEYAVRFERLKLPELVDIFKQYEGERAEVREANWSELKKATPDKLSDDQIQALYDNYAKQRQAKAEELKKVKPSKASRPTRGGAGKPSCTPKRSAMVKKLDAIFSQYIRLRATDHRGMGECHTCGAVRHWTEVDAGHFMSRACMSTRWTRPTCSFSANV